MAVGFYLDMTRCIGCRACQVACKDKNRLEVGTLYREVHSYTVGTFPEVDGYSYSFGCNHCEEPICLKNCPTGAIYRAPDGTVVQDQSKCIGCRMCPDLNEGSIAVLPSPDETHPNILIKAKDCAQDAGYRELTW